MEMNLFLAQSIQTQIELEEIADVKKQIINPSTSKTIIGVEQDGLIGTFNLTDPTVRIDWKNTMNIVSYTTVDEFKDFKKREYTGHELFSMIIPPKINLSKGEVKIENGQIKSGKLSKDLLGAGKQNSIHQLIWDEYGPDETVKFLNNNQRLINNFNLYTGFSIGIDDVVIRRELEKQIYNIFNTKDLKVAQMITELENNPELMDADLFEKTLYAELNVVRDDISKIIQSNQDKDNQVFIMAKSGSKGDATNSGQMSGCVGMQGVSGQIIQKKVNGRTLPYFFQNDDRGEARGLIKPSFAMGMGYPQFFFLNQAGREGLIDGAVKTAESGYVQRKLIKTMEDLVIKYDSTLRNVNNTIVQFVYGDSGADTRYQYEYTMKLIEQNNQDIENIHGFTPEEQKENKFTDKDNKKLVNSLINIRDILRHDLLKSRLDYITLSNSFLLPVNISRIINSARYNEELKKSKTKLEPQYVLDRIDELMENVNTRLMCLNKEVNKDKSFKIKDEQINKTSLKYALYDSLSPRRAIVEYDMNKEQFDSIFTTISENYNKNIIQAGEHAGILSAQAMGEPVSQMSCSFETMVHIYDSVTNTIKKTKMGEFIDTLMKHNPSSVIDVPNHKNSTVMDLPTNRYKIVNVSNKEKTAWQTIEQISKHPANGQLMTIRTRSGKSVTTTLSHSHLKREKNSIVPIKGSELKIGDRIPVTRKISFCSNIIKMDNFELTKHFGWICGAYLADGSINGNQIRITKINKRFSNKIVTYAKNNNINYKIKKYQGEYGPGMDTIICNKELTNFMVKHFSKGSFDKEISGDIFNTNKEFIAGLLSGYFDGDGNVNPSRHVIRASSRSNQMIEDISMLLNYFGIFATLHTEKEKGENKKPFYTLHIQHKYAKLFKEEIGLITKDKSDKLDEIIEYAERDNNYSLGENVDMIPELGETIAKVADYLEMPGRSRLYRRYLKKKAIGRETLGKYINRFNTVLLEKEDKLKPSEMADLILKLSELKQAYESNVVWDEIMSIDYEDGGEQYVYDFTVPGNDSFMVNSSILVHNTLKAFHKAGIAAISDTLQGVPRIKELFSLSKKIKTPQMIVYLTDEYYKNKEMAEKISSYIRFTTLGQIRRKVEVFYDPSPYMKDGFMEKDNVYNIYYTHNPTKTSCQVDINNLPWLIRIELDREKMLEKEVTLLEIKSKFCNQWERRYADIKNIKKEEKYILDKIIQCALLSNTDNDEKPVIHLRFDMTEFDFNSLNEFIDLMVDRFKLKGIYGINEKTGAIEERVLKFDKDSGAIIKDNQYVIYTQGVNLMDIRYLTGIDVYKTICNDVLEMYTTFGIEAARAIIVREISLAFRRHGADVNYNHLSVVVDLMTLNGNLMSIDRHGMNKSDNEPLARVSFEKMVEQLITSAVFNEVDNMKSVSSRIMAGLVVKGGTGMCDVILDTDLLEKSQYIEDTAGDYDSNFKELGTSNIINDMIGKEEMGDIFMPM
jgi:DNA-directed RNA polymerase beta' subunit